MVPQVSGYVVALAVTNAQLVESGDLLARIDQRPFVLEVDKVRSALHSATHAVGASSSQVEIAQASLTQAEIRARVSALTSSRPISRRVCLMTVSQESLRCRTPCHPVP